MTSSLYGLTPSDLSFPDKFTEFREVQLQIADWVVYGDPDIGRRRFMIVGAPGGSGKTLATQLASTMLGVKTAVLTYTRGLEDQILSDGFNDVADIRGKQNYECLTRNPYMPDKRWTCEDGIEIGCDHVGSNECTHRIAVEEAKRARVVLSNYSCWIHSRAMNATAFEGREQGPVKLLVLDECHLAPSALSGYLSEWVSMADLHKWVDSETRIAFRMAHGAESGIVSDSWIHALSTLATRIEHRMSEISAAYRSEAAAYREEKEYRRLSKVLDGVNKVTFHAAGDKDWIWQQTKSGVRFDCIWPAKYAERYLFSGVENVLLISATARPKLRQLLGIKKDEMLFREWPRIFPAVNGPVVHVPTGKMGHKASEDERLKSVRALDDFLDLGWIKMKGIVHTASYPRAEWVQSNSKYGKVMLLNKRGESADEMAERFRLAPAPCILVSPSYGTGYDFDLYEQQEWSWQFIIKLPYADRSDPIVQARCAQDPDWYGYDTMQTLCQSCWRLTRRPEAKCMTVVTDNSVKFLLRTAKEHKTRWFNVIDKKELPKPPANIRITGPRRETEDEKPKLRVLAAPSKEWVDKTRDVLDDEIPF